MDDNNNIDNIETITDINMMIIETESELNYKLLEENIKSLFEEEKNIDIFKKPIINTDMISTQISRTTSYEYISYKETIWELEDIVESEEFSDKENVPLIDEKTKIINKINEARTNTYQKTNESCMFGETNCYCCNNYLTIHNNNIGSYLSKYDLANKSIMPRSSSSIRRLFKLRPDIFKYRNPNKYRFLKNYDNNNIINPNCFEYKYEILTYDIGNKESVIECSICKKELCSSHYDYNPYYIKKCSCCSKKWNICSWCLYDFFHDYIIFGYYFRNENIFCELIHQ